MGLGGVELVASRVNYGEYLVTTRREKPAPQQQDCAAARCWCRIWPGRGAVWVVRRGKKQRAGVNILWDC